MSWALAALAVATAYSANKSSKSAKNASRVQKDAALAGIDSEELMFDRSLELNAPYREAGYDALVGLQALNTPGGRTDELNRYYAGDEFAAMEEQAAQSTGRRFGSLGGLRSGSSNQAFASIAPQLGQSHLRNRYNNLTGLANMGMGASSQGAEGASTLGGRLSGLHNEYGEAGAYNSLAQGRIANQAIGELGGLAYDYINSRKPPPNSPKPPPSYNTANI